MSKLLNYFKTFDLKYFFGTPTASKGIFVWLGIYIVILVAVFLIDFKLRKIAKTDKPYKKFSKLFFWTNFYLVTVGLLFLFIRYESLPVLSWRFWSFLIVLIITTINGYFLFYQKKKVSKEVLEFRNKARKDKWIKKKK